MKFPDDVKAYLVDDWENVTKNHMLYSLPSEVTVSGLLKKYLDEEREKRDNDGFAVVEEVVAGLRDYFDKCLGRILLYRYASTHSYP